MASICHRACAVLTGNDLFCHPQVSAYGFLTDDHQKYSNYYFERNANTSVIFYLNHDYGLEKKVWKDLHDSGIIRLYQRTGSAEPKP